MITLELGIDKRVRVFLESDSYNILADMLEGEYEITFEDDSLKRNLINIINQDVSTILYFDLVKRVISITSTNSEHLSLELKKKAKNTTPADHRLKNAEKFLKWLNEIIVKED